MPYTIYCPSHDQYPAQCFGVFDTQQLAERHGSRNLKHRKKVYIQISEPLLPENMLSLTLLRKASNFALTVLRNTKKAEKEGYYTKAIDDLEEALIDRPEPDPTIYIWHVHSPHGDVNESRGATEEEAIAQLGHNSDVVRNWRQHFRSVERVAEAR